MKFAESTKKRGIIADSANYALKITNFAESSVKSAESTALDSAKSQNLAPFLLNFRKKLYTRRVMILFDNRTETEIGGEILAFLEQILAKLSTQNVELLLVSDDEIRALNREFLGRDYATDVLSFPLDFSEIAETCLDSANPAILGSIVISLNFAKSYAKAHNHSLQTELAILFTHGLLHILGYDHESDNGEHRKKEREILAQFGIKSLIERNGG